MIEQAIHHAINIGNLHIQGLGGGTEDRFTKPMGGFILHCFPQVTVPNPFGGEEIIDNITYLAPGMQEVDWALEAKHYTPHQGVTLQAYLRYSVGGCIKDILKLIDCGFQKFYIVQLQTHITQFHLLGTATYEQLYNVFPAFRKYISNIDTTDANINIQRAVNQNRIHELEVYSRQRPDAHLICGHLPFNVTTLIANINVTLHYLISGPFFYTNLYPRLAAVLNPALPFEGQVGGGGLMPTWDLDVSIASGPNE